MPIDHLNNTRPEKVEKPHGAKGRIYRATLWTVDSGSGDVDTRPATPMCKFDDIAKSGGVDFSIRKNVPALAPG